MTKGINYLLITILIIFMSPAHGAYTANYTDLYPIQNISFYSNNIKNPQEAAIGELIFSKIKIDSKSKVTNIVFAEQNIPFQFNCTEKDCSYDFKLLVTAQLDLSEKLRIEFSSADSEYNQAVLINGIPIKKITKTSEQTDILSVNFFNTKSKKLNFARTPDNVTLEIISSSADLKEKIKDLKIFAIDISPTDIQSEIILINGTNYFRYTITKQIPSNYVPSNSDFSFNIGDDLNSRVNFNSKQLQRPLAIITATPDSTNSISLQILSNRENPNQFTISNIASADNSFMFKFKTPTNSKVEQVSLSGENQSLYSSTCDDSGCENIIYAKPKTQKNDINFGDLNIQIRTPQYIKDINSKLLTVRDYKQTNFINRLTFGLDQYSQSDIQQNGYENYINKQLNLATDNSGFENSIPDYRLLGYADSDLKRWVTNFMLNSRAQVKEKMAYFWRNHFNTMYNLEAKHAISRYWGANKSSDFTSLYSSTSAELNYQSFTVKAANANANLQTKYSGLASLVNLQDYNRVRIIASYTNANLGTLTSSKLSFTGYDIDNKPLTVDLAFNSILADGNKKILEANINEELLKITKLNSVNFYPTLEAFGTEVSLYGLELIKPDSQSKFLFAGNGILQARDYLFFRDHALGNFKDLLLYSAKSQNMLVYLDAILNTKSGINENYAREILELHTVGVNAGYTNDDIAKLSRFFTGMDTIGEFFFLNSGNHLTEPLSLSLFTDTFSGNNASDLEIFLDKLAKHPSTAKYICFKFFQIFVNENPKDESILACADVFLANQESPNQIATVLSFIINHKDFSSFENYQSKISNPLVFYSKIYRNFNAQKFDNLRNLQTTINNSSYNLLTVPVPTGYEEKSLLWYSPMILNQGISNLNTFLGSAYISDDEIFSFIESNLSSYDAESISALILARFTGGSFSRAELDYMKNLLGANFVYAKTPTIANSIRDLIFAAALSPSSYKN